jgi:hypothetical protein
MTRPETDLIMEAKRSTSAPAVVLICCTVVTRVTMSLSVLLLTDVSVWFFDVVTTGVVSAVAVVAAVSASETSVNFYQTTLCNTPQDSHLHTHGRENLNFHQIK